MSAHIDEKSGDHALETQLSKVSITSDRPLLITDADEVLFAFMRGFERHLHANDALFNWESFRLNGNILARKTGEPLPNPDVRTLLMSYFEQHTRSMDVVDHAPAMLQQLSLRMQIVVLSNLPHPQRPARAAALQDHGMSFPIISNEGSKADAVAHLSGQTTAPVFFIDDSPTHHREVAEIADHVVRIHFISNPRLGDLLGPAEASHFRARDWPEICAFIEDHLDRHTETTPA
ncbi:MAG: hypothetical protein CMM46_18920 [Rhodospirillaceae bacterium]|nr:hypothetical protein [Rhodospirillaceae bacterium]|tara:strand:+ start:6793 stop:7491 length:699 start_codon:yes stop_codon:yes gene_type:complete